MKYHSSALALLLSASSSSAFTPSNKHFGATISTTNTKYEVRRSQKWSLPTAASVKTSNVFLRSTMTPRDVSEIIEASDEEPVNGLSASGMKKLAQDTRDSAAEFASQYTGQTGAAVIYSKLQEHGVTVVNGYSGGAVLPIIDQFHADHSRHGNEKPSIRWITNSNESSAGHVAEGYAKACPIDGEHKPVGVALATSGPGVTNLITPLQDAICDGVPMVVICGQAATTAPQDAFQSAPAVDLTAPCTKWSYQIKTAAELPFVLDYAFYVARNGRPGPVFIDVPKDLQNQVVDEELIQTFLKDNLNGEGSDFARLVERQRAGGEIFGAVHLGRTDEGLSFEIVKDAKEDMLKLKHVPSASGDQYDADHNPRNRIYHQALLPEGDSQEIFAVGDVSTDDPVMKDLAKLLHKAKRPFILAGQGCNDCPEDLARLAEKLQIPVASTLHALGVFDERHDLALNMLGMHGHPTPNFMIQESDLVLCVGSRFDDRITGRLADFIPEVRKAVEEGRGGVVHVDVRLSENAKQVQPTHFVHSTGKHFLQTMNAILESDGVIKTNTGDWIEKMRSLKQEYPIGIPKFPTVEIDVPSENGETSVVKKTALSAQSAIQEMNMQLLKAGAIDDVVFTTGVGVHQMIAAQLVTWTQPRQMISSGSLGTMGVSLGFAIGAKLAQDGKIVISIDGDGSFNMTFTELKTVMEQNIPIKIFLLDNESQMMVEYWQRLFHEKRYLAVRNTNPKYTTLAQAFGIKNMYCDCEEDLPEKVNEFLFSDPDRPVLFHVKIERTPCLPLVAPGQRLENMILEDEDFEVDPAAAPS